MFRLPETWCEFHDRCNHIYILHCSHICLNFVQHLFTWNYVKLGLVAIFDPTSRYVDRSCRFTNGWQYIITLSLKPVFFAFSFVFFFLSLFFFSNFPSTNFDASIRLSCKDSKMIVKRFCSHLDSKKWIERSRINLLHSLRTFQFGYASVCSCYIIF